MNFLLFSTMEQSKSRYIIFIKFYLNLSQNHGTLNDLVNEKFVQVISLRGSARENMFLKLKYLTEQQILWVTLQADRQAWSPLPERTPLLFQKNLHFPEQGKQRADEKFVKL